jgi:sucrose-6-phosphate hydrolase SacC (GH32 family)
MVWIESQCAAIPEDPDDDLLVKWKKIDNPFLKLPPKGLDLTGWRDPFIFQFGKVPGLEQGDGTQYSMLIGAGIKGKGGTALVYKSNYLNKDWELQGLLCEGCADDTGVVWECPLLVPLRKLPKDLWATNRRSAPKWLSKASTIAEKLSSADLAKTNTNRKVIPNIGKAFRNNPTEKRPNEGGDSTKLAGRSQPKVIADFQLNKSDSSSSEFNFENTTRSLDKLPSAEMFAPTQNTTTSATVSLLAKKLEQAAKIHDNDLQKESHDSVIAREPSLGSQLKDGDVQNSTQDMFEAAKAKIKPLSIKPPVNEKSPAEISREKSLKPLAVDDDWYFFTVSPDAPTNPVLYWTGHVKVNDDSCPQFDMSNAKGPYRLDLGDILYAPNVCQDEHGRWLLWGWLQERRKVGSYAYAGCLTLPRILHVSEEGRLIQAPIPELERLRSKRAFHAQHVTLFSDSVFPIKHVKGERLDIICSIERGSAGAAGILFRSHEAEADGSTAVIYDWCNNQLEAIFNVPPTWKPITVASGFGSNLSEKDTTVSGDMSPSFDPATMLFTPKVSSMSRNASFAVRIYILNMA